MPHTNHLTYEFGPYKLSVAQRVLTRDGEIISLTPKATEILVRLVVNAGQLLEKDDLLKEVWPDTFVEEANLTQNIFTLRRALGDERAGPRYIETVSRRGYRFVADVRVCDGDGQGAAAAAAAELAEAQAGAEADDIVSPRPVVAVLPFLNETGDDGLEYLAEGVTDNIINNLSRVSRMRVMSRSAVFRRNARAVDPQTFGRELGATAVLVGKITSRPATLGRVEPVRSAILNRVEDGRGTMGMLTSGIEPSGRAFRLADASEVEPASRKPTDVEQVVEGAKSAPARSVEPAAEGVKSAHPGSVEVKPADAGGVEPASVKPADVGGVEPASVKPPNVGGVEPASVKPVDAGGGEPASVKSAQASGKEPGADGVKPRHPGGMEPEPEGMKRPPAGGVKTVLGIGVELVDVATGWQIWGESFDCESNDLLQIQDSITRQLLVNLKLKLTGEEEKRVTARYTENALAYQAYLEGRYHWSRYTRKGIETAIKNFRRAIELDPNYALAYAAIVDCYLRLATNYLPPEEAHLPLKTPRRRNFNVAKGAESSSVKEAYTKIKLRFEWDWKGAERELRRANELKTVYPAAHQWYAAYRSAQLLFAASNEFKGKRRPSIAADRSYPAVPDQVARLQLTPNEHVQICCAIARDQIDVGNYAAASEILKSRWVFGDWPKLDGLTQQSCADLLFTAGELAGCVASTRQLRGGQKHGEALLNGSIAIFEQLCSERMASEGRIELALCYYRQGLFELGRSILKRVLDTLSLNDIDLQSLALIRLASLERHAGRLKDALSYLKHAESLAGTAGPWTSGRCYLELASTYKDLAISEETTPYCENGKEYYRKALHEFEAVGNHRLCAIVENNLGVLLLIMGHSGAAEGHLLRARAIFHHFDDRIRRAQVDESLAQLYLAQRKLSDAQVAIEQSVQTMELGDEDACLAESLTTKGLIYCELYRYNEAQKALDGAYRLASRCGDTEGAGKAILILVEKLSGVLAPEERSRIRAILLELLSSSRHDSIKSRAAKCLKIMDSLTDPTIL